MYYFRCPCKKSVGNNFPKARLPPLPFLAKTQLHAYGRKFKINRGFSKRYETLGTLSMYYFRCPCQKLVGNFFSNVRLPPLPFLAKMQLHAYRRKVKRNRGLVETLRNFGDTLNVLFEMSMQKISRKLFS